MKDDAISRQWLMECVEEGWIKFDTQEDENRFVHLIRDIAPSAQPVEDTRAMCGECDAWNQYKNYPQPGWIPCSERLPEAGEYYLVTRQYFGWNGEEYKEIDIAKYEVDGWRWFGINGTVVAWRELPDPWKGERE